jgi:cytidylate kinase
MNVTIGLDPDDPRVSIEGDDVTQLIRSAGVTGAVSDVATNLKARAALGRWQRSIIDAEVAGGRSGGAGIVVEGRDITTVIAPDAQARVLMTADPEVRVSRRAGQDQAAGRAAAVEDTRASVLDRDRKDAAAVNFETAADGVLTLDTTHLSIDEAVAAVIAVLEGEHT